MAFTIVTPSYGIRARKTFINACDESNFKFSEVWLADEQPLQDPEIASLEKLKELIEEVNRDSDNAFLIRGHPQNRNDDNTYGLDDTYWFDRASNLFQLDLDFELDSDKLNQDTLLHERVDIALEALPFLKGKKFLAQLSSGAGLPIVAKSNGEKKNYPKKLCLRLFVETKTNYKLEEIAHYLNPYIEAGLVDSIFQPTRRHYIQSPELINTPCALSNAESLRLYEGELLGLEGLNKAAFNPTSSKKTYNPSKKPTTGEKKRLDEIKNRLYKTDRAYWGEVLEEYAKKGYLTGIRNDLYQFLFRREAFFNHGNCTRLIDEILDSEAVLGDRDRKNLEAWERIQARKLLAKLRQDAQTWSLKHPEQTFRFEHIDLKDRDWSDLKTKRAAAIKSGCGTNKTKGVIYDLVKWAKETDQSLIILTPFIAVTESIAKDVDINHYHIFGTKRQQKLEAMLGSRYLATCYQSLEILGGHNAQFDIVIIDEASLVWRGQGEPKGHTKEAIERLYRLCDKSKHLYALCADIDTHTLDCLEQIENYKAEDFSLYLNSADYGREYEIEAFEDYEMILQDLINSLNKGKRVAVAVDSSEKTGWITAFKHFLQNHCPNVQIKGFDAETVKSTNLKAEANETISNWMKKGLNCLIVSPFCSVGWDYLEEDYVFDEVYVIGTNRFLSAQRLWQWIRRFRLTRKAKYYLIEHNSYIDDKATRKLIEAEKNKSREKLTRIEDWQIKTKDALALDQANVSWYFRELCKDKGARLTLIPKPEEKVTRLQDDFKEIRKAVKNNLLDKLRTEQEEYIKLIESFGVWRGGFVRLNSNDYISDKQLASFQSRNKYNEVKAERFCRFLCWSEEDLKALDDKEVIEFNVLLYKVYEALWLELSVLIPEKHASFAHWYSQSDEGVIYGHYKQDNLISVKAIASRHWKAIKQEIPSIGHDCFLEPNRLLSPLCRSLDLSVNNHKERPNIKAVEAKKELYEHYDKTSEPNFNIRVKEIEKRKFCIENCFRKQKEGVELSRLETRFLQSRPNIFIISRKKFISSAWYFEMDRARQTISDRNGVSTNHTRYCPCEDCAGRRVVNF